MKISSLENHLRSIKEACGDIEVVIVDADTGWLLRLNDSDIEMTMDSRGGRVEIGADYDNGRYP